MAQPFFTESAMQCDAICNSLQNAWNEVVIWYNEALGYQAGVGDPIYLTQIPIMDAYRIIVTLKQNFEYLRGMIQILRSIPNKSLQLQSLFDYINFYIPFLKNNITKWSFLLQGTLKEILEPEAWQRQLSRSGGLVDQTLDRLLTSSENVYGPNPS